MRFQKITALWTERPAIVKALFALMAAWLVVSLWMWNQTRDDERRAEQAVLDSWTAELDNALETAAVLEDAFDGSALANDPYFVGETFAKYIDLKTAETATAIQASQAEASQYVSDSDALQKVRKRFDDATEQLARASVVAEVLRIVRDECSGLADPWHESVQLAGATVVEHHAAIRSIAPQHCEEI